MTRLTQAARIVLLGCAVSLLPGLRAIAATSATMTIDTNEPPSGAVQGKVKGSKLQKNAAPATVIQLLSVTRPTSDAAAGSAAGRKVSSTAFVVTKVYDANSAILEQAEATNQFFPEVTIAFPPSPATKGTIAGSSAKGSKAAQSTSNTAQVLVLKNAQITAIEQTRNIQQISIEYQSIEVTSTSGKTTAADDWEMP